MVEVRELAEQANRYFDSQAPWALVKSDPEAARCVLTSILNVFRVLAIYLKPVLPSYAAQVETLFGEPPHGWDDAQRPFEERLLSPYNYLATRIDPKAIEEMVMRSASQPQPTAPAAAVPAALTAAPAAATAPVAPAAPASTVPAAPAAPAVFIKPEIDIETFGRLDLRVAKVVAAELVEGADKLLKLLLDIGGERPRQVFAGIRKAYDPATLVGRHVVLVANLAPRKMRFGISEGMVLAAGNADGGLFLVAPDAGAQPGATVK
jgi:methionyl-tRNA synthetase